MHNAYDLGRSCLQQPPLMIRPRHGRSRAQLSSTRISVVLQGLDFQGLAQLSRSVRPHTAYNLVSSGKVQPKDVCTGNQRKSVAVPVDCCLACPHPQVGQSDGMSQPLDTPATQGYAPPSYTVLAGHSASTVESKL